MLSLAALQCCLNTLMQEAKIFNQSFQFLSNKVTDTKYVFLYMQMNFYVQTITLNTDSFEIKRKCPLICIYIIISMIAR